MYRFIIDKIKKHTTSSLLDNLNERLQNHPEDVNALNNRAILNIDLKKYQRALDDLNKAIYLNDKFHAPLHFTSSAVHLFKGYVYLKTQNKDCANEEFKEAIFQDHDNKTLEENYLRKVFAEHLTEDSKKVILKLKTKKYLEDDINYYLAIHYLFDEQYKESENLLYKLSKNDSYNAHISLLIGVNQFYQDNLDESLSSLKNAESILKKTHHDYHVNSSIQYYNRAYIHYKMHYPELACNDLNKSLDLHIKNIDALFLRAEIFIEKGDKDSAKKDMEMILHYGKRVNEAHKMLKKIEQPTLLVSPTQN
jgi:tetratricopeptide (TPR) repeat protein